MEKLFIVLTGFAIVLGFATAVWLLKPKPVRLQAMTWLGDQAKPLPEFALTDHNHQPFTNETIKGKWHLLFFGYTHCPDVCPTTLQMLADAVKKIKDPAVLKQLQIDFITVDPDRDDLASLKPYVTYFNKDFIGVRGDMVNIDVLTHALGILHYIVKSKNGKVYEVAHSGNLTLIDPKGRFIGIFSAPHDGAKIAHDLSAIIESQK